MAKLKGYSTKYIAIEFVNSYKRHEKDVFIRHDNISYVKVYPKHRNNGLREILIELTNKNTIDGFVTEQELERLYECLQLERGR